MTRKNHSLATSSNWKSPNSDNSPTFESIKADSERESSFGMIRLRKNLKSAEWSSYMPITWRKLIKSEQAIFLPSSE